MLSRVGPSWPQAAWLGISFWTSICGTNDLLLEGHMTSRGGRPFPPKRMFRMHSLSAAAAVPRPRDSDFALARASTCRPPKPGLPLNV
ncbi:hypothetical protein BV20DRAFT_968191 [Pilatotrama ljubarskyi]|nr:hypothetical protein BV20DRAFT_968191 [Pilatotrama ljubarskyi]